MRMLMYHDEFLTDQLSGAENNANRGTRME